MFEVRPSRDLEEYGHAIFGIGQYFGARPDEQRLQRFSKVLDARADARRARGRRDRRRRRRVHVRLLGARRHAPVRRRDRRRRLSDASPARRPARADGRAAARRARARRADRRAVGERGDDLRALRLRDRVVGGRGEDRPRVGRVRAAARAQGTDAVRDAGAGARALSAGLGGVAPRASRRLLPHARLVGAPDAAAARRGEGEPEALRRARPRRRDAGLCGVPHASTASKTACRTRAPK